MMSYTKCRPRAGDHSLAGAAVFIHHILGSSVSQCRPGLCHVLRIILGSTVLQEKRASPVAVMVKSVSATWEARYDRSLKRSPREGNGNSLQYSCQENPMDGRD